MEVFNEGETNVKSIVQIVSYFVFGAIGFTAMLSVKSMTTSLTQMNQSLHELNKKMAVVVSKQDDQRSIIRDHEKRIREVERLK